jgi:hypothetical protein
MHPDLNLIAVSETYQMGRKLRDAYVPDPNFRRWAAQIARQADKEQDTEQAQRSMSIAENWITHAKKIGDATALFVKTTRSGKPKED